MAKGPSPASAPTSKPQHHGYQFERECPGDSHCLWWPCLLPGGLTSRPMPHIHRDTALPLSPWPAQGTQSLEHPARGHSLCYSICTQTEVELPRHCGPCWHPLPPHPGVWPAVLHWNIIPIPSVVSRLKNILFYIEKCVVKPHQELIR